MPESIDRTQPHQPEQAADLNTLLALARKEYGGFFPGAVASPSVVVEPMAQTEQLGITEAERERVLGGQALRVIWDFFIHEPSVTPLVAEQLRRWLPGRNTLFIHELSIPAETGATPTENAELQQEVDASFQ